MAEVLEINDLDTLSAYRAHWDALLARTPDRSFFLSYDWFVAACRHAQSDLRIRVLIVFRQGQPIGILPLVVRRRTRRFGEVRVLGYPLSDWGAIYGPIGPAAGVVLRSGLAHIRRTPRDWDIVDLSWVNRDETDLGQTARAMQQVGFAPKEALHAHTAQVELDGGWENYWASRKSHWRTNVRRSEKRLAESGTVRHVRYRPEGTVRGDDDPRWDLFDACVELAARSWQGGSESGTTLSHVSVRAFLRDAHLAAVRHGSLDLNLLLVDEKPVAFAYNYHYDGYVYGLRMGFDRQQSDAGVGSVLLGRAIRDSFARGDRLYDLGPDYLACKRQWWTRLTPTYRYTHYPWSEPKAQAVRLGRWVKRRLAEGSRNSEVGSRKTRRLAGGLARRFCQGVRT